MKKILSLVLLLVFIVSALASVNLVAMAEDEEANYVRFTSGDFDPYATFSFSPNGNNTEIDADLVKYAAIRYRTITLDNESGIELGGQIYVYTPKEPYIPVIYNHSNKWETVIVDMSTISVTKAGMDSVWDSDNYSTPSQIRFDMMEPNRENPNFDNNNDRGHVRDGSQIDIAWVAFFEKEEDAKAYTGKEKTPYCLLDVDCLIDPISSNNVSCDLYTGGQKVDDGKLDEIVVNKRAEVSNAIRINDHELAIHTIKVPEGKAMRDVILTNCPTWSNTEGNSDVLAEAYVWAGDYDTTVAYKPIASVEVLNHRDNNACYFNFGTALRYGYEYLIVVTASNDGAFGFWAGDEISEESGWESYFDGELDNSSNVPPIAYTLLDVGELPDYELSTFAPATEAPTDTPAPTNTPAPATAEPTATPAPTEEPKKSSGCGGVVLSAGACAVMVVAVVIFRKKH